MPDYGQGKHSGSIRGPYGTNEGDIYFAADWLRKMTKNDQGKNHEAIIEMLRDKTSGKIEEHFYITNNKEIIARAHKGNELFLAGSLKNIGDKE